MNLAVISEYGSKVACIQDAGFQTFTLTYISSSALLYFRSQICSPMKGVGTDCSDLQHYTHCAEEFALPVLAACHKLLPALGCPDLIKRNSSINHRDPSPYYLRQHRAFQAAAKFKIADFWV
jgi:hypothetical protein